MTLKKIQDYSAERSKAPIFVVGYMHSGTTLLINILKNHTSVFSGNRETKYFMHLPMIRKTFPKLEDDKTLQDFVFYVIAVVKTGFSRNKLKAGDKARFNLAWLGDDQKRLDALLADAKENRNHETMFALVSDHLTRAMGKTRWVEKTPTHIFHIDEIVETVPNALFVEIVRDVRDVLASKKTRRTEVWQSEKYAGNRQRKHLEKAFDPFWDSLSWLTAVRAGQTARKKYTDKIYSVKYEDLVKQPEQEIRKICSFLGMNFEPEMLNVSTQNSAAGDENIKKQTGIVTTSIGRWKSVLTPAETAVIQWRSGREMNSAGYEISAIPFYQKARILFALTKSSLEFFQRLYRRWRFGGWLYFQNILESYLKKIRLLWFPTRN